MILNTGQGAGAMSSGGRRPLEAHPRLNQHGDSLVTIDDPLLLPAPCRRKGVLE